MTTIVEDQLAVLAQREPYLSNTIKCALRDLTCADPALLARAQLATDCGWVAPIHVYYAGVYEDGRTSYGVYALQNNVVIHKYSTLVPTPQTVEYAESLALAYAKQYFAGKSVTYYAHSRHTSLQDCAIAAWLARSALST